MTIKTIHKDDELFFNTIDRVAKFSDDEDTMMTFTHNDVTHEFFWTHSDGSVWTQDDDCEFIELANFGVGIDHIS